jgi:hypothetical protein
VKKETKKKKKKEEKKKKKKKKKKRKGGETRTLGWLVNLSLLRLVEETCLWIGHLVNFVKGSHSTDKLESSILICSTDNCCLGY